MPISDQQLPDLRAALHRWAGIAIRHTDHATVLHLLEPAGDPRWLDTLRSVAGLIQQLDGHQEPASRALHAITVVAAELARDEPNDTIVALWIRAAACDILALTPGEAGALLASEATSDQTTVAALLAPALLGP